MPKCAKCDEFWVLRADKMWAGAPGESGLAPYWVLVCFHSKTKKFLHSYGPFFSTEEAMQFAQGHQIKMGDCSHGSV